MAACVCVVLGSFVLAAAAKQLAVQEKSFLWRIQTNRGTTYLLGSIHFLKKDNYPLKRVIEESFAKATRLVFEIDIASSAQEQIHQVMLQKGLSRDGTPLAQNVSKETYGIFEKRASELGFDLEALKLLKPWLAALTIQSLKLKKLGFDHRWGVDRYLAERAQQTGKGIAGLESAEFQIGLFDGLSARDQELMLRQSLKQLDIVDKSVGRIVQSWSAGDVIGLEKLLLVTMRDHPKLHQKLIVERHRRWLPKIETIIGQNDSTMIIVGAAHLLGKEGLVELLRSRGYTVEQL